MAILSDKEELMLKAKTISFAIVLLGLSISVQVLAQVDTGTISGTVRDPSGAVVPNAKVTIRNSGTGLAQDLTTDSTGLYVSLPLYAGEYDVEAEASGFRSEVQHLTLAVAERRVADFSMHVGIDHSSGALIDRIVSLRQQHKLKLPDAIIAATAVEAGATLITDDAQLRKLTAVTSVGIH
jgi:predicted nucleic acid-binding protein